MILNHTLFFTLLGGVDEEMEGGILFKNDFVIFDEAHTMESVASRHIGLSVSSGQVRYSLNRLWNPRTEKGLLATLRQGKAVKLVAEILSESDKFFENVETACEEIQATAKPKFSGGESSSQRRREWKELRIRRAELVKDNVTLPIQRLREAVSELVKTSDDKDIGQELIECNRRLGELKVEVAEFLSQQADDHVYWVERGGKSQRNLSLNAAPVDVAEFLRRRLFETRHERHHDQRDAGDFSAGSCRFQVEGCEFRMHRARNLQPATSNQQLASKLFCQTRRLRIRHAACRSARRSITSGR